MTKQHFGVLLTKGIRYICARENKPMQVVQDELGYAVGHTGGSAIRYWRQGHCPSNPSDVETLARAIVQRGDTDRNWLEQFLHSANFPNPSRLCDELFPSQPYQYLPVPPTKLIGRKRETTNLIQLLQHRHARLVTLTGSPGVGKTRLALHLAQSLRPTLKDGAIFVSLASTEDPDLMVSAIALAIGFTENDSHALKARLIRFFRDREILLVLDNFEQIISAALQVSELLSETQSLKIVATSREPLHIYGEYEYAVNPLALPEAGESISLNLLANIPSVQLFVERATAANTDFRLNLENADAVAAICRELDGLPLAIELAAPQSKWLTAPKLLAQLTDRIGFLVHGPLDWPARHQTLHAAIDWSYDRLNEFEKKLFRCLSVFQGGCTLEAVEIVCRGSDEGSDDGLLLRLESLQDKNLLLRFPSTATDGTSRYSMLETIHEYATQKLQKSDEIETVCQRHLTWCLQLAEDANQNLRGPDQLLWLNQLELELNNIRKALLWCIDHPIYIEAGLKIVADLNWFWSLRSRVSEGLDWLRRLLAISLPIAAPPSARQAQAQAMRVAAHLYGMQGDGAKSIEAARASVNLFEEIGDQAGIIASKVALSLSLGLSSDVAEGIRLAEETLLLCRENGDRFHEAELLDNILGDAAIRQGDYAQAIVLREHSLELRRALHDIDGQAWSLFMLAGTVRMLGDMSRAQTLYEESTALWRQLGSRRWYADVLDELGRVNCNQGNYSRAKALFEESLTSAQSIYDQYRASRAMCDLATVACLTDDHPQAQSLLKTVSRSIWELLDSPLLAIFLISEARLASATHLLERAACMAGAAQSALKKVPPYPGTSDLMEYEEVVSLIRPALSQEEFARAYAEGQAMSFETALAL